MVCHKGEKHHRAVLTEKEVREIKQKYRTGKYMQIQLAEEYVVPRYNISKIVNGVLWGHVDA